MSDRCAHARSRTGGGAAGRTRAQVVAKEALGSLVHLTVEVSGWPGARAGQFALLQAEPSGCFLARALSISAQDGGRVSFLLAPVGTGTRELAALGPGGEVWVLGPLGNGFPLDTLLDKQRNRLLLVAGGVGAAPFPLLLAELTRAAEEGRALPEVLVLLGFRDPVQAQGAGPVLDAAALLEQAWVSCRCVTVLEEGVSAPEGAAPAPGEATARQGRKVTDALETELLPHDRVAVCGPPAMAEVAWRICSGVDGVRTWFSLETAMACGVGSCHGCVLPLADGSLARVCLDGPVFRGEQVWAVPPKDPSIRRDERDERGDAVREAPAETEGERQ